MFEVYLPKFKFTANNPLIKSRTHIQQTLHEIVYISGAQRPACGPHPARDESWCGPRRPARKLTISEPSTANRKSSRLNQLTTIFSLTSLGSSWRCPLWSFRQI